MITAKRLQKKRKEILGILASYGVRTALFEGDLIALKIDPDVELFLSSDRDDKSPVLLVFRNSFLSSGRAIVGDDTSGWGLSISLSKILNCRVSICDERALENFHPLTHDKAMLTRNWQR